MSKELSYNDLLYIVERQEKQVQELIELNKKLWNKYPDEYDDVGKRNLTVRSLQNRISILEKEVGFLINHLYKIKKGNLLQIKEAKTNYQHRTCFYCGQVNSKVRDHCINCGKNRWVINE